jgi:2,4-dienoyl-CoA reductase-like NADH-dependent reductase (Old Yellow Enzyme family)
MIFPDCCYEYLTEYYYKVERMNAPLFTPLHIGDLQLPNRIVIAPMCQYSAADGSATDWHMMHLGNLALSGAGLLIVEATAVSAQARISPQDLGLYSDANQAALGRVLAAIRRYSPIHVAIQLAHAGRKASMRVPWEGGAQIAPDAQDGWQSVAPSGVPHAPGQNPPVSLDQAGLMRVREEFVAAARRAVDLKFEGIELHGAHGYLLHEFLSPVANRRSDEYGGSLENRMRFPLEVFDSVRAAIPANMPVWMRISATDWMPASWDIEQAVQFARALELRGCAAVHVSSGGISPQQALKATPNYQVPFAQRIKANVRIPVIAVGLITEPAQAQAIIANGQADAIALARAMLYDPRWPWHAAATLGARAWAPNQYLRCQPSNLKHLFDSESPA